MIPTFRDRLSLLFMLFIWLVIAIAIIGQHLRNILGGVEMWTPVLTIAFLFEYFVIFWPACDFYFKKGKEGVNRYWGTVIFFMVVNLIIFWFNHWLGFLSFVVVPPYIFNIVKESKYVETIKGREMSTYADAKRTYNQARSDNDAGYFWGGVFIPSEEATTHFLVAGASGSGKTITLRLLMQSMLPKIQSGSNCRALIYDAKRDILSIIAGINNDCPIWILNPFDQRCVAWDMAKDINTYAQAESLANILVPKVEKEDPFFRDATVSILKGVIEIFMENAPGAWDFRDILLAMRSRYTLGALLESNPDTEDCLEFLASDATAASVMSTIKTKIGVYRTIAALWHRAEKKISLNEWAESSGIIVIGKDNQAKEALSAINQLIFTRVAQILLDKPEVKRPETFIVLDELASIGKLNQLKELAEEGRSKGVCLAVGFQSIKSIENVYNEKVAEAITGQFRHKAFLRLDSEPTAEWASKLIGDAEIRRITEGVTMSKDGRNRTLTEQFQTIRVVKPSEFLSILPINENIGQGMIGYYLGQKAYQLLYPIDFIRQNLWAKSDKVPDFLKSPDSYQRLEPWTEEDLHRLSIHHILRPNFQDSLYEEPN